MNSTCLQLKGSVVTTFILELYQTDLNEISQQLTQKINQAPEFFKQSSVVISLDKVDEDAAPIDLLELITLCREQGLQPMAFKCSDPRFLEAIKASKFPLLSENAAKPTNTPVPAPEKTEIKEKIISRKSKIISRPVRSGQQIYAEDTDLIILSHVNEGAEVLADGNIHVYGSLRGRALAGVKGDVNARIFCQKLEAELVSIAGNFILSDTLRKKNWEQAAQIYLDEQNLHVEAV